MNKILTTFLLVLLTSTIGFAQKWKLTRHEVHFGLGTINVFGDIGGTTDKNNLWGLKDIRMKETGVSVYGGFRYKLNPSMALKLNMIYGYTSGTDLGSKNETRAFSFKTSIFEPSIQYEYYFLKEDRENAGFGLFNRNRMLNNFNILAMYGFIGAGGILANPKFSYGSHAPNPLIEMVKNEGSFAAVLPVGLGVKFSVNNHWAVGFELGKRFAFSDYVDGLSTTYSHHNDTYYFSMFSAIYRLESDRYGKLLMFKRSRMPYRRR